MLLPPEKGELPRRQVARFFSDARRIVYIDRVHAVLGLGGVIGAFDRGHRLYRVARGFVALICALASPPDCSAFGVYSL